MSGIYYENQAELSASRLSPSVPEARHTALASETGLMDTVQNQRDHKFCPSINSWNFRLRIPIAATIGKVFDQCLKTLSDDHPRIIRQSVKGQLDDTLIQNARLNHEDCRWIARKIVKATHYSQAEERSLGVFYGALARHLNSSLVFSLLKDPKVPKREILAKSHIRAVGPDRHYKALVKAYSSEKVTSFLLEQKPSKKEFLTYRLLLSLVKAENEPGISHLIKQMGLEEVTGRLKKVNSPRAEALISMLRTQYDLTMEECKQLSPPNPSKPQPDPPNCR